jgi:Mrp family chromosome partitioning ATPase
LKSPKSDERTGRLPEAAVETVPPRTAVVEEPAVTEPAAVAVASRPPQVASEMPAMEPFPAPFPLPEEVSFRPMLQVDDFSWPAGCARLARGAESQLNGLVELVASGVTLGRHVVGVAGANRGDGCTTLVLCIARRLAGRGLKVAMVDADFEHPRLARRLGLSPETGWDATAARSGALADVSIESIRDAIALVPLCDSLDVRRAAAINPTPAMAVLRKHYDVVLVDLGRCGRSGGVPLGPPELASSWIDAAMVVHNVRVVPASELVSAWQRIRAAGIAVLGTVENFG